MEITDREFAGGVGNFFLFHCMGRVVWTVGWFPPALPHPAVVWGVVVNTYILWDVVTTSSDSPVWSVVWYGDIEFAGGYFLSFSLYGSGCLDRGVVPPGRTTPRGRVRGRGQHIL